MRTRVLVAVLIALTALIAWFALASSPGAPAGRPSSQGSAAREPTQGDAEETSRANAGAPARAEVAAVSADKSPAAAVEPERLLRGRVSDVLGAPVVGANVQASNALGDGFAMLDLERRAGTSAVARATTDERGEFALRVEPLHTFQLEIEAAGFARTRVSSCKVGDPLDIVLQRASALFGRVTRRGDGSPVAAARVACWPKNGGVPGRLRGVRGTTETDADGNYQLDGLTPGEVFVDVAHEVEASPEWVTLALEPGQSRQHDATLDPGAAIRGRVIDAATGQPIAQAQIGQGWTFEKCVLSDDAGEYVFRGFSPGYAELTARARGYGKLERVVVDATSGAITERVDFELTPERTAHGRVVDVSGNALAGAYVAAVASEFGDGSLQRTDWCSATSDERGVFHAVGLRRDLRHTLFARRDGYASVVYEFPPLARDDALVELGDIVLPPPASLSGSVVDAKSQPLPWQAIELRGANADRARLLTGGTAPTWGVDLYVAQRNARSDDAGRFAFSDLAPGHYVLSARLNDGHSEAVTRELNIEAGANVRDLVLVLERGLSIEGRVSVPDGGEMPTVYLSVDPEREGRSIDCEAASDGRFVANGLSAGTYTLSAYPYVSLEDRAAGRLFLATKLSAVAAGSRDIVLELRTATHLRGRVVDAANVAIEGAPVVALDMTQNEVDRTSSRADGSFELLVPANEPTELRANLPDDPDDAPARTILRGVEPARGEVELRLARRG